jgi:hypothetical protein
MSSIALLIGCNYSTTQYKLFGCVNDVLLINKMLINNFNYKEENIIVMRDDIYSPNHELFPSYENILKNLKKIVNSIQCENIYIHYSGHGSFIIDKSRDESDGKDEFICPADFFTNYKRITDDDIFNNLKDLPKNTKCFAVFDSCNSGTMLDLSNVYSFQNNNIIEMEENQDVSLKDKSTIICLSACRDNEYALDVMNNGKANGAMTLGIFSILSRNQYVIDLRTFLFQVYEYLKSNNYNTQRPLLTCNKKINLSDVYYNFNNPKAGSSVLLIDDKPITITMPQPTTTQPTTTQPTTVQPTTTQPLTTQSTNVNLLSIKSVLEMCLKNNLVQKQELKDLIAQI